MSRDLVEMVQMAGESRSQYVDIGKAFDAPDGHFNQTRRTREVLACKFVGDLANTDILAAIASCSPTKTSRVPATPDCPHALG